MMFLDKLKNFVFQKGIGLKIIIPFSFLIAFLLSLQFTHPFQESLKTPEIQSVVQLIASPDGDISALKEELKNKKTEQKNFIQSIITQALITLKEKGLTGQFSVDQLNMLLKNALYLQAFFLSLIILIFSIFSFLFLYFILTIVGPFFYNELEKNMWGRILSLVWTGVLIIYLIAGFYQLTFGLTYFYIISILSSLLIGVYLKRHS